MSKKELVFNARLCVGCHACEIACMDQNDTDICALEQPFRRVMSCESTADDEAVVTHLSASCRHCKDAHCMEACPAGAIKRDLATDAVYVRQHLCIGCRSCSMACPFGVPRFGGKGVMEKCDGCRIRVRYGYEPACSRICPSGALSFANLDELQRNRELEAAKNLTK